MLYLSGAINRGLFDRDGIGFMLSPLMGNRVPEGAFWAADNGCFSGSIDVARQVRFLTRHAYARSRCLFAVLPDVYNDAAATSVEACRALEALHATGYPLAYVIQPGARSAEIPWSELRCLFVGGRDAWHFSPEAIELVNEARDRGLWTHNGRVNSRMRILASRRLNFDSIDGTTVAWSPGRYLPRVPSWLGEASQQLDLF